MEEKYDISAMQVERIAYIWARYEGRRDATPEGKHYSKTDIEELIRRLKKFKDDPSSFDEGFEVEYEQCRFCGKFFKNVEQHKNRVHGGKEQITLLD